MRTCPLPVPDDYCDLWVNLWHNRNKHRRLSVISRPNYVFFHLLLAARELWSQRGVKVFIPLSGMQMTYFTPTCESHKQLTSDLQSNKSCYHESAEAERWKRQSSSSAERGSRNWPLIFTQRLEKEFRGKWVYMSSCNLNTVKRQECHHDRENIWLTLRLGLQYFIRLSAAVITTPQNC